jgi:hypothetical protein
MNDTIDYITIRKNLIKNWVIKNHFKNEEEINELYNEFYNNGGECLFYSFVMYQKLQKIGAKRCRGRINATNLMKKSRFNEVEPHHSWVETHNMVYDKTIFRTIIAPKKEWYEFYQVSNVEYADNGIFIKNNYCLNCGPDNIDDLKKHLLPNKLILEKKMKVI